MTYTKSISEADAELTAAGQMFEIDEVEVRGIPTKVWKHTPATLADILRLSRGHADSTFIVYGNLRLSFEEHFRASAHVARLLRDRFGVREGDRVAIAMRNMPEWSIAFWGAVSAGAVVVPLNAWWTGEELQYGLADSGTRVLLADGERISRLVPHLDSLPAIEAVIGADTGSADGVAGWADVFGALSEAKARPADMDLPTVTVGPDDDATIFYTSGTTGRPKGALGTHRNICTNPLSMYYVQMRAATRSGIQPPAPGSGPQNSYLLSVPLFHATGCHAILVTNILAGGKLVMMPRWDAGQALELIEREKVTIFGGVPTMVMQVLDHPDLGKRDTSTVKSVGYGGAPAPPELVRRIKDHFDTVSASNGYGLTETSSLSTMNIGDDYVAKPDSVGPPVPVVSLRVVSADGATQPAGSVGELWIKGPNVVKGYWNNPAATAAAITDGWFHTGDIARIDEEGFVYIVDRAKDMLIRGGENVYCVEIEGVLYEHPAVAEAAVIGIPHPVLGEEVGAVVALRPGRVGGADLERELREFVGVRLAAFKVPAQIWFQDGELPRNPAGKVLKRELRESLGLVS